MPETGERLQAVLGGYAKFIREKALALAKHRPYLVRWVREFLAFAGDHSGHTFEQTLDLYMAEVGKHVGAKLWQVRQAADAVRIHRYQYLAAGAQGQTGAGSQDAPMEGGALVARLREVIRLAVAIA